MFYHPDTADAHWMVVKSDDKREQVKKKLERKNELCVWNGINNTQHDLMLLNNELFGKQYYYLRTAYHFNQYTNYKPPAVEST